MPYYAITGIQDGLVDDPSPLRRVPLRMELDDWCNSTNVVHKNQRALFFPAFNMFCQMDPKKKLSYWQIAGIHGQPFIPWDEEGEGVNDKSGYCTHNSILFTTWHRPYMLLFEQVLYELMNDVAGTFPESEQPAMFEAMQSWRFPYWDWAAKKPDLSGPKGKADYNVPIVIPFRGIEIKVPASVKAQDQQTPSFAEGAVWPDPSVPEPGEHRQAVTNPFYQFTMVDGYENMGDPRLGKLAIIADHITDPDGVKFDYPLNDCKATTRHAKFGSQPDHPEEQWIIGAQDNDAVVAGLRNPKPFEGIILPGKLRAGLSDAFYRVVTQIPKFEDFGTKRFEGNGPDGDRKSLAFDSAENIHDFIHFVCGGPSAYRKKAGNNIGLKGHMSHVPVAAFDPIFWVHHCNVDRMVAIWEVLHNGDSDNWFDGTDERDKDSGNWAIEKNHPDLPSDPLRPFHKDEKGNYWTSNDIRETAPLGYNYPELEKWKYVDGEGKYDATAHKDALTLYLNNRYNSAASAAVKAILTPNPGELEAESDSSKPSLLQLQALTPHPVPEHDIIGAPDYVVNIVYNRFAFGGQPYTINIFVGRVPENVPYTFDDPEGSLVGQVYTFSSPADRLGTSEEIGCVNCRSQEAAEVMSSGTVVLTNALITRWKNQLEHTPRHAVLAGDEEQVPRVLKSMEPKDVVPFLQANLRWRVTSLGGIVAPERLESLRVSVAVGKADHFADQTKLSRFYNYQGANEVTRNRLQGAGPDDGLYPPN